MFLHELFESPIDDITRVGMDDTENNSFVKTDARLVNHPKMDEKLYRMYRKAPVPINLVFYNNKNQADTGYGFKVNDAELSRLKKEGIQIRPDCVNVLLTHNNDSGRAKVPMTPWIVGHRIAHALLDSTLYDEYKEDDARRYLRQLFPADYGVPSGEVYYPWEKLGTFASARESKLLGLGEFVPECMVQFMITGKVKLNVVEPLDEPRTRKLEKWLEWFYLGILKQSMGKVFLY